MGKGKQKFNKKQAVRFTLVPAFDQNGKPITHFRPVQTKKSKVSLSQRQKIIRQISDQTYDQIQINGRMVGQNQIPAFVLQQIKGRKDLVFNQKQQHEMTEVKGDLYDVVDAEDYDDEEYSQQEKVYIDKEEIIDEEYSDEDEMEEWEDEEDEEMEEIDEEEEGTDKKAFKLNQEDFPVLNKVNIEGQEYELTEAQIKLLDVLIPQNYEDFDFKGLKFEKYDEHGLPLSQKSKYQEFLATGNQGIVDTFDYVPDHPTPIYDTDMKPSEITGDMREIENALNFEGEEGVYEELEDDFFAKLVQSQIQANKKQKKSKKHNKLVSKEIKPQPEEVTKVKLPKQLQEFVSKDQANIFSKYDELHKEILEEEITDEMIEKALDDFEHNLEPKEQTKFGKNKLQEQVQQEMIEYNSGNNQSMNFSEIEKCTEFFGKDGQLDWRCLSKKEKKEYMKTKIIRSFYDEVREREIEEKLKGKKNVTSEELHLKTRIEHLSLKEDHVMQKALEKDAQQVVDLQEASQYSTSSDEEDIVEYHQRTSVISSNLNEISEISKKRPEKKKQDDDERLKELDELSQTLNKLKTAGQKRDRAETKQERKERKQKQKEVKKEKKEIKKQFAEKFAEERRKQIKMSKPSDPLHKVAFVKII